MNEWTISDNWGTKTQTFSPVCVRKWRLNNDGRSNALPQYSQGSMVRSRGFFTTR